MKSPGRQWAPPFGPGGWVETPIDDRRLAIWTSSGRSPLDVIDLALPVQGKAVLKRIKAFFINHLVQDAHIPLNSSVCSEISLLRKFRIAPRHHLGWPAPSVMPA